jgi:starch phosphorylase
MGFMLRKVQNSGVEGVSFDASEVVRGINRELKHAHDTGLQIHPLKIETATPKQIYFALARYIMNDMIMPRWHATLAAQEKSKTRKVYYLSMEFLIGRALSNNLINLMQNSTVRDAIQAKCPNFSFDVIEDQEAEAGLGNGGLGRLAACYLESAASQDLPFDGFGLWYDKGIFEQIICDGEQKEKEDGWLKKGGYRWKIIDKVSPPTEILFGGEVRLGDNGRLYINNPNEVVKVKPYKVPVVGYGTNTVNTLNLWTADKDMHMNMDLFNLGDYHGARRDEIASKTLTTQLYPNENHDEGKILRLKQEFLLSSASLHSIITEYKSKNNDGFRSFADKVAIQINDTHPALAVPELMRMLIDEETIAIPEKMVLDALSEFNVPDVQSKLGQFFKRCEDGFLMPRPEIYNLLKEELQSDHIAFERVWKKYQDIIWQRAWQITGRVIGYTNHTVLAEAMEKWPRWMLQKYLPRQEKIIDQINAQFVSSIRAQFPGDDARIERMSIYFRGGDGVEKVRMAHLAIVGGYSVNGVAALHTDILKNSVLRDFYEMYPTKFHNVTNGVTQRRWILDANPELAAFITKYTGSDEWIRDLSQLKNLEQFVTDDVVLSELLEIKKKSKICFADFIRKHNPVRDKNGDEVDENIIDPDSIFVCQSKRLHEYKRQLLTALYIHAQYNKLKKDPAAIDTLVPQTYVFGAKAAPGYDMAKNIIKYINILARTINNDPALKGKLKVVYLENYNVSKAEIMIPAADLSLQISTAGLEASGTGNMKYSMNGALTVGTLDGANVEMAEFIGEDNMFIFGALTDEIEKMKKDGSYNSRETVKNNPALAEILDQLWDGDFARSNDADHREHKVLSAIASNLLDGKLPDPYFVLHDYASFAEAMEKSLLLYQQPKEWAKKMLLNIARMWYFSSDRSILEYAETIWRLLSLEVEMIEDDEDISSI